MAAATKVIRMKVTMEEARANLGRIEHRTFQKGMANYWKRDEDEAANETVTVQSVCWLFCWAKTGQNSKKAQSQAQRAFGDIFNVSFNWLCQRLDHELAVDLRYSTGDVKDEFYSHIGRQ